MNKNIKKNKYLIEIEESDLSYLPNINYLYYHIISMYENRVEPNYSLIDKALEEDYNLTLKLLFYLRDKNDGLGLRKSFFKILNYIGKKEAVNLEGLLEKIPQFGRWDDLYALFYTKWESDVIKIFSKRIKSDLEGETPSNLGKWLKSINSSSKETRKLGIRTSKGLGLSLKEYRRLLSLLRSKINILEKNLSSKKYGSIKYGELSFYHLNKYKKAFLRNDRENFLEFKEYRKSYLKEINNDLIELEEFKNDLLNKFTEKTLLEFLGEYNLKKKDEGESIGIFLCKKIDFNSIIPLYISLNKCNLNNYHYKNKLFIGDKKIDILVEDIKNINKIDDFDLIKFLDELLLNIIRKGIRENYSPKNIYIYTNDINMLKIGSQNICSEGEKRAFLKSKILWEKSNYIFPTINIINFYGKETSFCRLEENFILKNYNELEIFKRYFSSGSKKIKIKSILDIINNSNYNFLDLN